MGALEKTIRGFAERDREEVVKPELGTTFDSLTEAYDFYNLYSWEHMDLGLGTEKADLIQIRGRPCRRLSADGR